jgi:hypothetical protein
VWTKQAAIITEYEPRLVVAHHIVDSVNSNTNNGRPAEMSGVNKRAGLEHSDQNPRWRYEGCDSLLSDNHCTTWTKGCAPLSQSSDPGH